jgi:hypothetical protein
MFHAESVTQSPGVLKGKHRKTKLYPAIGIEFVACIFRNWLLKTATSWSLTFSHTQNGKLN